MMHDWPSYKTDECEWYCEQEPKGSAEKTVVIYNHS